MNTALHTIDCDADPYVPEGWKVLSHKKDGQVVWDLDKVGWYATPGQLGILPVLASDVEEELKDVPVQNANVLDYLVDHPDLVPETAKEWLKEMKDMNPAILFWGTIYEDDEGERCVRCLCLSDEDGSLIDGLVNVSDAGLMEYHPAAINLPEDATTT